MRISYFCRWGNNKETAWSGTNYSLYKALSQKAAVTDYDMTFPKWQHLIVKLSNITVFHNKMVINNPVTCNVFNEFYLKRLFLKYMKNNEKPEAVLEIGCFEKTDIPFYTYQDICVDTLRYLKQTNPVSYSYSTYQFISDKDLDRRAEFQNKVYSDAKGMFTMGRWLANYMIDQMKFPAEKVHWVGGGTNIDISKIDESQKTGNKFLFVGRDFIRKGGDLVCEAFRLLQKDMPEVELYVAGPSIKPKECYGEHVHFLGDLSYKELTNYFNMCDVFCMPSRFEAYGLVFVEALIFGLPCLARNAYEMKYFIQNNVNGCLIEEDNIEKMAGCMRMLLTNDVIKSYVRNQRQSYISQYSWSAVAARILEVMKQDLDN